MEREARRNHTLSVADTRNDELAFDLAASGLECFELLKGLTVRSVCTVAAHTVTDVKLVLLRALCLGH